MSLWGEILWLTIGAGLIAYALTGGADLGAGLWSLLASGPRRAAQREATVRAIAPIWEANHVWLIFIIVVMFSAFSRAFSAISIALHIPIALALVGLVFRGAAFSFHAYGIQPERTRARWERVFTASSIVTPIFLGTVLGGLSSGAIVREDGQVTSGFVAGWTSPFSWLVGLFALSLFALLSAAYLAAEAADADEAALADDFRARALAAELVAGLLAALVFWRASVDAPALYDNLARSGWTLPVQGMTAVASFSTIALLWRRQLGWARLTAATQVALVVIGWGLAMDHHFILPSLSAQEAVVHDDVLRVLTIALGCGTVVLAPSLWYLFRVFKRRPLPGGEQR